MTAYLIVDLALSDLDAYKPYVAAVPAILRKHGGEYVVRGGAAESIEGDWLPGRLVLVRFADRAAAHAFLADPEYAPWKALRQRLGHAKIVLVDAVA